MPICPSAAEPIIHRKLCADENEVGQCYTCDRFVHRGEYYTMIVVRKRNDEEEDMAIGLCEVCSNVIATCSNLGRNKLYDS